MKKIERRKVVEHLSIRRIRISFLDDGSVIVGSDGGTDASDEVIKETVGKQIDCLHGEIANLERGIRDRQARIKQVGKKIVFWEGVAKGKAPDQLNKDLLRNKGEREKI